MEANRDSALNYIELAEKAIRADEPERAFRFLTKAEALFPTQKAKDLLERVSSADSHSTENVASSSSNNPHPATSNGTSSSTRQRTNSTATANDYTSEEVDAVRKIKTCKDLYDILGVSKSAPEADLKKAYRKLALQFHPDKCKAPGATEAFKAIGKAFSILSDPKKREQYDQYGNAMEPQQNRGGAQYYHTADDDEFSAEEIFNMFFGYAGPTSRVYRRRQQASTFRFTTHSTNNPTQTSARTLVQLLPYLFLFLISIIGTFLVGEPQFQLHQTGKYTNVRTTRSSKIEYYVKSDFRPPKANSELDKLEASIADEYVSDLRHQCYREQQYKESLLWRARMMNDNALYRQAQQQSTSSCTALNDFVQRGHV